MRIDATTRALVTGASRGIGQAVAEAIAGRGGTVGLLARAPETLGPRTIPLPADVGERDQVRAAVARFAEAAGGLDLAVANAGIAHYGPFREQDIAHAEAMTRINWLGTVYTVEAALEHGARHIVIVSSGAGLRAFPSAAAYGATKAAQRAFAEALRHELDAVSVTTVFPGEIATTLHDHEKDTLPPWYRGGAAAASPDRLAAAILLAVERNRRAVYFPPLVRLLGLNGLAPRLTDTILRRLRGSAAAPRRD